MGRLNLRSRVHQVHPLPGSIDYIENEGVSIVVACVGENICIGGNVIGGAEMHCTSLLPRLSGNCICVRDFYGMQSFHIHARCISCSLIEYTGMY